MAIATSPLHRNFKGAIGDFIFRTYNGKTVVSLRPVYKNETNTEARRKSRGNFREAANYASYAMLNIKLKAYYTQKAKQLKLPNAYTAAITDYLRKAKAKAFTRSSFAAKKDQEIQIRLIKGVYKINQVTITAYTMQGEVITTQTLTKPDEQNTFKFTLPDDWPNFASLKIVSDEPRQQEYVIMRDEFMKF